MCGTWRSQRYHSRTASVAGVFQWLKASAFASAWAEPRKASCKRNLKSWLGNSRRRCSGRLGATGDEQNRGKNPHSQKNEHFLWQHGFAFSSDEVAWKA